ncbi:MAG: gamma-glutamyl-gamma-aminobutyrate hydrolase family protein [Dehalococcoidia bacterium]
MPRATSRTVPRTGAGRPRILISRAEPIPSERWEDYAGRVSEAGGEPQPIDLGDWQPERPLPDHDGLVLTAGVDVDPARYGEARSDHVREVDARRDDFETALIEAARAAGRPLFAICRGHQLFNVALGGSLLQHLEEREPHRARRGEDGETIDSGWHDIDVAGGTLLATALGLADGGVLHANSRHHQAVTLDRVAPGLVVVATTPDGVVEGLVDRSQPWALSVQWHPEMAEAAGPSAGLWTAFVAACAEHAESAVGARE